MKKNWSNYVAHVVGWAFLYIVPYLISFEGYSNIFTLFSNPGDYLHLVSFAFLIIFFYVNYWLFVPEIYFSKKYIRYAVIVAVCFWIVIYLPIHILPRYQAIEILHHHQIDPPKPEGFPEDPRHAGPPPAQLLFGRNYTILLFIVSLFVSISLHTRRKLHFLEKEKMNAELSLLKSQINPHFLFNTLNSIYALVINKDDRAADAIVQLSELMRYTLKDSKDDLVDLDKEIDYLENYISLQEARLGETVYIDQKIAGKFSNKKIPPLILITFLENAFMHGTNPNQISEITINISTVENVLMFSVKNKKVSMRKEEGGIGLQNIKDRLQLIYPSQHSLKINDNKESYLVELVINL